VRSHRLLSSPVSLAEIVLATATLTASGTFARTEEPARPAPSTQPAPAIESKQDAAPAARPEATPERDTAPAPQDGRTVSSLDAPPMPEAPPSRLRGVREGRRTIDDEPVQFSIEEEGIAGIIPFIYDWTGKFVSYKPSELSSVKLTIKGTRAIPKSQALDFIFQALRMQDIAVTETEDIIYIGNVSSLPSTLPGVVIGPDEDIMTMADNGLFVTKVFRLKQARAIDVLERIEGLAETGYSKFSADGDSNQIIVSGDIGLAKKVQTLIDMLDVPSWADSATETFRLQYQDASTVASLIETLFQDTGSAGGRTSGSRSNQRTPQRGPQVPGQPGQQAGAGGELIVTVLTSMNSITVRASPKVIGEIRRLVASAWDLPPNSAGSIFRTYDLKYADPTKVRDLLGTLLGGGTSGGGGSSQTNRAFAGGRVLQPQGGQGGDGSPTAAVANIFSIEAYPDSNRLVVISKTPDNYDWLDRWIEDLDQPFTSGLPVNVPLKHASAVELSGILNTLLAQSGTEGGGLRLPEEGLSGLSGTIGSSLGGQDSTSTGTGNNANQNGQNQLRFPWEGARAGQGAGGQPQEVSALIGRSRVVPNPTQNSVLVMAPPEVEKKVIEIIHELDQPGRQVMITAVLAEVKIGDGFSWGARVGRVGDFSAPLNGSENSITGNVGLEFERTGTGDSDRNFGWDLFDTSTLTISTTDDLAFFLQALSQDNNVRILQQPRVFTSDNKEAKFVAGSDVSFLQGETAGFGTAGTTTSFQQQFVGVGINVRPRITQDNNVAMEVEILLSNLSSTTINSNPVVDRRQTNTSVTVKNGQTIVISGIRREQETQINRRVPFLGDVPVLGALFSSTERATEVVELVVFLVPLVVENPDANDDNFNEAERERLRMLQEPLEQSIDKLTKEGKFFQDIKDGGKSPTAPEGAAPAEDLPEP
jgi:type II secretion system protein D